MIGIMRRHRLFVAFVTSWMLLACASDNVPVPVPVPATAGAGGLAEGGHGGAALHGAGGAVRAANSSSSGGVGGMASTGPDGGGAAVGGAGGQGSWSGPLHALASIDLGDVGIQAPIDFPIPDRSLGFTVLATAPLPSDLIGIYRLTPESGNSVVFDYAMAGKDVPIFVGAGTVAVANPQSDSANAWPVAKQDWAIVVGANEPLPSTHLQMWVRRTADGLFHGGVIDFNVFLAPNTTHSLYVKAMLESLFDKHYEPKLGLRLGNVIYTAGDAAHTVIDSRTEFDQMLASSVGMGPVPAINLFVVADFLDAKFGGAIGIAGGIPGSPMKHGTTMSGVALQPSGDPDKDAMVLAHEIGHLGGLFHTTEFAIDLTDPLSDTATCSHSVITSKPGQCPDITNMMFPMAAGGTEVSAAQAIVMQGSALYRGTLLGGGQPSPPVPSPAPSSVKPWPRLASLPAKGTAVELGAMRPPRDEVERLLSGVWCVRSHGYEQAVLGRGSVARIRRLHQLALDPQAFDLVRARALRVLDFAREKKHALVDVVVVAKEVLRRRPARHAALTAIDLLRRHKPAALPALAATIRGFGDAVVIARLNR
jgi:hypothetical protein